MGIAEDVQQRVSLKTSAGGCKVSSYLAEMSEDDRAALTLAFDLAREDQAKPPADRYYTIVWLLSVFTNNGYSIGKTVISDHLRRTCACDHRQ